MKVRRRVEKHIEIDVGEFSFQNIIFILASLYEKIMVFPAFLGVELYRTIVGLVIQIGQFLKMMEKQQADLKYTTRRWKDEKFRNR